MIIKIFQKFYYENERLKSISNNFRLKLILWLILICATFIAIIVISLFAIFQS